MCDIPGLLGLVFITIISVILHRDLNLLYWEGFVAGAIGLHLAFSQSVLAFLSTADTYRATIYTDYETKPVDSH